VSKYVVSWTNTRAKAKADQKAVLDAFEAWTPPAGISEMLVRADGNGGGLIIETDDVKVIAEAIAPFAGWLDYEIVPVLDIQVGVDLIKANL